MARYRYRTVALTGRWRDSPRAARRDAVHAKQAVEEAPGSFRWLVPGDIEMEDDPPSSG